MSSFENLPMELQLSSPQIVLYGVANDLIQADDCSASFDSNFWIRAIQEEKGLGLKWRQLPTKFKDDIDLALSIVPFVHPQLPNQLLEHFLGRFLHRTVLDSQFADTF